MGRATAAAVSPTSLAMEKFKIEVQPKDGNKVVYLKGSIDEDTDFNSLLTAESPLRLNFSCVTAINSCGIRSWVNFLKEIADKQITFEECPPLIVRQMNMVPSFLGKAQVASVFIPYVCDDCDHEKTVLITSDKFKKGTTPVVEETVPCDNCQKGEMEFDGQPKQYFAFSR